MRRPLMGAEVGAVDFLGKVFFLLTLLRTHVRARTWARVRTRDNEL